MSSYTKEIEIVSNHSETGDHVLINSSTGHILAKMTDQNETSVANAELWKLSPDLLEAIKDGINTFKYLLQEMPKENVIDRHEISSRKKQFEEIVKRVEKES